MNERQLRDLFVELRDYERAEVPEFERIRARARARARSRGGAWVAGAGWGAVAVAGVAGFFLVINRPPPAAPLSITEWRATTDVLLEMPGTEWLGEMPTLTYEGTP